MEACNRELSILCDKFFTCLTPAELDAAKGVIGLNAQDCKTKLQGSECTAERARCNPGETFNPGNTEMCLAGLMTLTCTDIKSDPIVTPAICDQVCTR